MIAELSRAKRSTIGKKIWLSMHPKNFGRDVIVRPSVRRSVRPPLHVSRGEILSADENSNLDIGAKKVLLLLVVIKD